MAIKAWGAVFRELREIKGFSLEKVAAGVTTKQQVSRFELGESDLTLQKIDGILENLGLSFEEYLYHVRNYKEPSGRAFFDRLDRLEETKQFSEIERLYHKEIGNYQESKRHIYYYKALMLKASLVNRQFKDYKFSESEIAEVSDYLFSVLEWGELELQLFVMIGFFLPVSLTFEFASELKKRTELYSKLPYNRYLVVLALRNSTQYLITQKDKERAGRLLAAYKNLIDVPVIDVYQRKEYLFTEGLYYLMVGEQQKGADDMEKLALVYDALGYPAVAAHTRKLPQEGVLEREMKT